MNWISVTDRLPDEGENVLAWDGDDVIQAFRDCGLWRDCSGWPMEAEGHRTVTHWMEMPEGPQRTDPAEHDGWRVAGHFRELPSAMGYRVLEQAGHAAEPGTVELYERA